MVMTLTNRANPATPTKWRASYPSTRDRASQSLAEPSAKVNASTIAPMARVRGSTHAERPRFCERGPPARTAGRKALVAASSAARARRAITTRWIPSGTPNRVARTPSPAPVIEPRLHAAWNRGSTVRPSRVSTCAPSTFMATSQEAVPKPKRHSPAAVTARVAQPAHAKGDQADAQGHQHGAGPDDVRGSEPFDHPAAEWGAEHRPDGHGQQQQPELAVGQLQAVTKVGNPRPEGGEVQPVEDEDRSDGIAGARDGIAQLCELRDGLVCTSGSLGRGCAGQFSGMSVRVCSASMSAAWNRGSCDAGCGCSSRWWCQ